jgi:rubrerythrin
MKIRDIVGRNRSGALRAPDMTRAQVEGSAEFEPTSEGDADDIAAVRISYSKGAEPAATMPPPRGVKQLAKSALGALIGNANVFLDKAGERLAYERSGVRLYQALLSKHDAYGSFRGGPSRGDLEHLRDEELEHFHLLARTIERLGGDPTAVTPSANVQATATKGVAAVLVDPRVTFLQSLEVMLTVELSDNECWAALIELAIASGDAESVGAFREALQHEGEHLERVRAWVALGQGRGGGEAAGAEDGAVVHRSLPARRGSAGKQGMRSSKRRASARDVATSRGKRKAAGTTAAGRSRAKRTSEVRGKTSAKRGTAAAGARRKRRSRRSGLRG